MKSTGSILKQRRESLKISVAEVSIATKITPRMIQAIETGNMDLLPARTFLRGFVKSYASFLKMDLDFVLKAFAEEMAALEPPPVDPLALEEAAAKNPTPSDYSQTQEPTGGRTKTPLIVDGMSMTKKTSLGLGLVVLIAMIVFVYKMVDKYEREGRVEQPPPTLTKIESDAKPEDKSDNEETETKPVAEAAKPSEADSKKVAETAKPAEPVEAVKPTEPAKPAEVAKPVEPAKKPAEVAKPTEPAKPVEVAKPVEPVKPVEPPKPVVDAAEAAKPKAGTQEIIIEALDKVDITFRVNGGGEKKVSLQPDQYHTIKAAGVVAIEMSDGGAVNIIHNGRDMGVPGDLGRPKKLQLP